MANIMSMKQVQNKPSRNGFDLSFKKNFTAKAGELLPVMVKEVIPGDKFTIDLRAMTRTQPVNTAAFARIREYFDFYYVPYSLLWNRANSVLTQMNYNQMHANTLMDTDSVYQGEMPYVTFQQILDYLSALNKDASTETKNNFFGYSRAELSVKLLEYLGYGNFDNYADDQPKSIYNPELNIFGLLAYQKIYSDYYRNEQWEKPAPSTFNVDYMSGTASMQVNIPQNTGDGVSFYQNYNMFDMRYCNWQKDLYHGLLPHAQYGDTAVVPLSTDGLSIVPNGKGMYLGNDALTVDKNGERIVFSQSMPDNYGTLKLDGTAIQLYPASDQPAPYSVVSSGAVGGLSVLALRQYEFLQKWKEIAQSTGQNYKDQIKAMWNVDVSKHLSHKCTYLGGIDSSLDINEVVNTNITGTNGADIAGKGIGVSNGKITFDSDGQFGLIMCIYHALPIVDYTVDYIDPAFTRVNAEDFANPVFDRVGMQPVSNLHIMNSTKLVGEPHLPVNLGYAPRYIDYKTSIDLSVGDFKRTLNHWVVSYNLDSFRNSIFPEGASGVLPSPDGKAFLDYTFFKINPAILNPIFSFEVDSNMDTDQLLVSSFFDVKVVRNLDVDGLPY